MHVKKKKSLKNNYVFLFKISLFVNLVAIPQSDRSVTIVVSIYGHDDDSASKVPLTTAVALRQLRGTGMVCLCTHV